jgi:metal-responsive CopG/Arc/MetJ family transcriptional regulator
VANEKQQFNIYLPAELVRRVKHASVDANQSLSTFVEQALDAYLARRPETQRQNGETS